MAADTESSGATSRDWIYTCGSVTLITICSALFMGIPAATGMAITVRLEPIVATGGPSKAMPPPLSPQPPPPSPRRRQSTRLPRAPGATSKGSIPATGMPTSEKASAQAAVRLQGSAQAELHRLRVARDSARAKADAEERAETSKKASDDSLTSLAGDEPTQISDATKGATATSGRRRRKAAPAAATGAAEKTL
jgi:hypothetical protein